MPITIGFEVNGISQSMNIFHEPKNSHRALPIKWWYFSDNIMKNTFRSVWYYISVCVSFFGVVDISTLNSVHAVSKWCVTLHAIRKSDAYVVVDCLLTIFMDFCRWWCNWIPTLNIHFIGFCCALLLSFELMVTIYLSSSTSIQKSRNTEKQLGFIIHWWCQCKFSDIRSLGQYFPLAFEF